MDELGPWRLIGKLGTGGNATVWRAVRSTDQLEAAVKVVNTAKAQREPYRRFAREIEFLRSLNDATGVLPVLDAYLPEQPSADDRPWLAMPIARPVADALDGQPLEVVVEAVASFASTLSRLRSEHGLGHRDIKPANLYELDGQWLVGDFGLIAAPDLEELARTGRPLGPAHYTAYEMIVDATNADPHPADVYSLAKTLWVLATGQRFPPEGHQPADSPGYCIRDLRPHPQAGALDRLVDTCTRLNASDRPSMEQVAADLKAWASLVSSGSHAFDLGELSGRLRTALRSELEQRDRESMLREAWTEAIRQHSARMRLVHDALRDAYSGTIVDASDDALTRNMMRSGDHVGATEVLARWQRCTKIERGPDYHQYVLRVGRGIEIAVDGLLILHAFVDVGDPETSRTDFFWQAPVRSVLAGTVEAEQAISEGVEQIGEQIKEALEVFVRQSP